MVNNMRFYFGDNVSGWKLYGVRIGRMYIGISYSILSWQEVVPNLDVGHLTIFTEN